MISQVLSDLVGKEGMTLPRDFYDFMEANSEKLIDWAFTEISVGDRVFIFNNFLGATGELNTDLYKWYKFASDGSEYLTFGNGVYGESFAIKVKGEDIGEVSVFFVDEDGEDCECKIARSFGEFLAILKSSDRI